MLDELPSVVDSTSSEPIPAANVAVQPVPISRERVFAKTCRLRSKGGVYWFEKRQGKWDPTPRGGCCRIACVDSTLLPRGGQPPEDDSPEDLLRLGQHPPADVAIVAC